MTLLEHLKQKREEFKSSRIDFIKQEIERHVSKGYFNVHIESKYWDSEIVNYLRKEGLTVEVVDQFESKDSWFIKISGWE